MANTGNTQQQINYGAAANDGQGDPLRTAFIKTDDNFDAIWNAGPVGSNITIVNNTIQSNNVNGNITIRPNGVGVIQANAAIVPNATNLRDLGTADQRFRAAYVGTGGLSVDGNVTVTGNLTAGNISYTGNVFVGDLQGSVYADDSTIMVDAVDNAMFADSATFGTASATGNVAANFFIGNGSLLTGIASTYGNANVAEYLVTYNGNLSANNISAGNVFLANNIFATTGTFSGDSRGENAIYAGVPLFTVLGSDVVAQFSADVDNYTQFNFQNGNSGPLASGDYVITADNGTDSTYFFNMGLGSSTHDDPDFFGDTSSPNDGYLYVVGADATGPGDTGPGNLIIGSTNGAIKFFVGNTAQANVVQTITTAGVVMTGNLIPSANAVYSLGNATNYWSNLWVANNISANNVNSTTSVGLPVFANSTVRDAAISSPQPGMMIFVTGTGLQVRGATAWNTVAGTAT